MSRILTDKFTNFTKDFKMECYIISVDQKTQYFKDGNSLKLIYEFHAVPTKSTTRYLTELYKLVLALICKYKDPKLDVSVVLF